MTDEAMKRMEDEAHEALKMKGDTYAAVMARALAEGVLGLAARLRSTEAPPVVPAGEKPSRLTMADGRVAYAATNLPGGSTRAVRFLPPVPREAADRVLAALVDGPPPHVVAAVAVLNAALEADPGAMTQLFVDTRFPCTAALAAHPAVQVRKNALKDGFTVSALGIVNGVLGVIPSGPRAGWGWVSLESDEDGPLRFVMTTDAPPVSGDAPSSGG